MSPRLSALTLLLLLAGRAAATIWTVADTGGDFTSIQAALDVAVAGDTVQVRESATPYFEKIAFPRSGNPVDGPISLEAFPGEQPILDGTNITGDHMVWIENRSHLRLVGFEIRNNLGVNDGSGVRIEGAGSDIEIRDNRIHDMRGQHAMGITVYGTSPATPISDLVIDGNEIHDCEPYQSEALVLNGNVTTFAVTNNVVRDVNNIGIDFIGGETDINPDATKVARNGVCRGNVVLRAREQGGGFAGGIYVDGGRDIVIENNLVMESDLGIEIGAENPGTVTSGITVRNNVLAENEKAGLVFGGFQASVGRVVDSAFTGNTGWHNDTLGAGFGELWIQWAEDNVVASNVFVAADGRRLLTSDGGNVNNQVDHNVWWTNAGAGAAPFSWNGTEYAGFAAYQSGSGADAASLFADPLLAGPAGGDFHLGPASPAVNAGDPGFTPAPGEVDLDGGTRVNGPRVDAGADEATTCGDGVVQIPELCDDGDLVDGDGCDSNCTPTGCGNGIVTAGEACDDGGQSAGDCCDAACQLEPIGAPCDDGIVCTTGDTCAAGTCSGLATPRTGCRMAGKGKLVIKQGASSTSHLLAWTWKSGDTTTLGDFGDPGATSDYTLCLYDTAAATPSLVASAQAPAGGLCSGKPCWKALPGRGHRYKDRDRTPDGLLKVLLKTSAGDATLKVKGKGDRLPAVSLPFTQDPAVTVQLVGAGTCWQTRHEPPAKRNDAARFIDVTEP